MKAPALSVLLLPLAVASCVYLPGTGTTDTTRPIITTTAATTTTTTLPPHGSIVGRVYLGDRIEPVHTSVFLRKAVGQSTPGAITHQGRPLAETRTDQDGYYTFSVQPGTYQVEVSVQDLRDICDRWPRLMSGMDDWPEQIVLLGDAKDSLFRSVEIQVGVGDEIALDLGMNLPCE